MTRASGGDSRNNNVVRLKIPKSARSIARPVTSQGYTREEAGRMFGIAPQRLASWERVGLARPSAERDGERAYTFQDLVVLRAAVDLSRNGISVPRIRRALDALRRSLPTNRALSELRILCDGKSIIVRDRRGSFDPVTGQLFLDFDVRALEQQAAEHAPLALHRRDVRTAYDYYLDGCRLDGDPSARSRAAACYLRAIALDPSLACAYTNLGALRIDEGNLLEARRLFERAVALDAEQPEAAFNLGCLELRAGNIDAAQELFLRAIDADPEFADAHATLATVYESQNRRTDARAAWRLYLSLCPEGRHATLARERLRRRRRSM